MGAAPAVNAPGRGRGADTAARGLVVGSLGPVRAIGVAALGLGTLILVPYVRAASSSSRSEDPKPGAQEPKPAPDAKQPDVPRPKLPPRVAVGGVRLLETTSTVVFAGREKEPHELVATFAFPERARLALSAPVAEGVAARELRYRFGPNVYGASNERASTVLAGAARLEVLRDLELRAALFLWPDGVEWKGDGLVREAARGELGTLRATLPARGAPPTELALVDAQGACLVAFRAVTWVEEKGRRFPATLEAWRGDALGYRETVQERDTTRTYVDSYFLPGDRREGPVEFDRVFGRVRDTELPRFAARRVELAGGLTWSAVRPELERITREWAAILAPKGLAVEPNWTVELGAAGEPKAVLVRLAKPPEVLPEGFAWSTAGPARVVALEGVEGLAGIDLSKLRESLPPTARLGAPYVRVPAQPGGVLVVQPWAKGE